jgi:hypothetical protein
MKRSLATSILMLLAAIPTLAAAGPRSLDHETLVGAFADPARPGMLQAGLRWGEIRVRGHEADEVRVESVLEVEASLAARLTESEIRDRIDIRLVERQDGLALEVESRLEGFYSIDLDIRVPRGASLALEVRDGGNIRVEDVLGEVEIANRNGSVDLAGLGGAAVVHSRNGSIRADFAAIPDGLPMSFSSLNGSVDVTFPEEPAAEVRIRYNRGGVESDFPIAADLGEARAETAGLDGRATRLLSGRLGAGGPTYYFHTANGTVYLRRAAR